MVALIRDLLMTTKFSGMVLLVLHNCFIMSIIHRWANILDDKEPFKIMISIFNQLVCSNIYLIQQSTVYVYLCIWSTQFTKRNNVTNQYVLLYLLIPVGLIIISSTYQRKVDPIRSPDPPPPPHPPFLRLFVHNPNNQDDC